MQWKVHTPNLLKELIENNPTAWACRIPVLIFRQVLKSVAERAIELDDPQLNILMLRLQLYEVMPSEIDALIVAQRERMV